MTDFIHIYTDGSCDPNPGNGGWGAVVINGAKVIRLSGSEKDTTNNRMELLAVIKALEIVPPKSKIKLFSDSRYVVNGCNDWHYKWQKREWKTTTGKPVENQDLWRKVIDLLYQHYITVEWIAGHANNPHNEDANQLAAVARMFF